MLLHFILHHENLEAEAKIQLLVTQLEHNLEQMHSILRHGKQIEDEEQRKKFFTISLKVADLLQQ